MITNGIDCIAGVAVACMTPFIFVALNAEYKLKEMCQNNAIYAVWKSKSVEMYCTNKMRLSKIESINLRFI